MWVIRNSYVNAADSAIESQLFQSLSALVLRHHPHSGEHLDKNSTEETMETLVDVLNVLQQAAAHGVPQPEEGRPKVQAQPSMERVKNAFEGKIARVSALSEEKTMGSTDIEMIDMVGLLFDYILNDDLMPDSVKALLSHLHTPYLKIALLNKDFFVREEHPARKLLNAITQAGSRCPSDDPNDLNVVTKIQSIVNQILDNFSDNTDIFTELLDDFSTFIENLERRSNIMEQRSVEAVEGQEKLHEARRLVSEEVIKRCSELKRPPKVLQELLLNTWAHSLVITLLRNGKKSTEWREALAVTDALIWRVKPKTTQSERELLRAQLPVIAESVRAGLLFGGLSGGRYQ